MNKDLEILKEAAYIIYKDNVTVLACRALQDGTMDDPWEHFEYFDFDAEASYVTYSSKEPDEHVPYFAVVSMKTIYSLN